MENNISTESMGVVQKEKSKLWLVVLMIIGVLVILSVATVIAVPKLALMQVYKEKKIEKVFYDEANKYQVTANEYWLPVQSGKKENELSSLFIYSKDDKMYLDAFFFTKIKGQTFKEFSDSWINDTKKAGDAEDFVYKQDATGFKTNINGMAAITVEGTATHSGKTYKSTYTTIEGKDEYCVIEMGAQTDAYDKSKDELASILYSLKLK